MSEDDDKARRRFEELYDEHFDAVHRYARRRTSTASAEDVVAEVFEIAWRRLDRVPAAAALPWLYRVAANVLANERRAVQRAGEKADRAAAGARPGGADPADAVGERDVVVRGLAALDERDRETLRLVAWEGLALGDAARAAGVSRAAFAMRLHRARRRLEAHLDGAASPSHGPLRPRAVETPR